MKKLKKSHKEFFPSKSLTGQQFPTQEEVLKYLQSSDQKVGKREIARFFKIKSSEKQALKKLLAKMTADGLLNGEKNNLMPRGMLPNLAKLQITGRNKDGDLIGQPLSWNEQDGPCPIIFIEETRLLNTDYKKGVSLADGDQILARLIRILDAESNHIQYEARFLKKITHERKSLLGIYHARGLEGGKIDPVNRKELKSWHIPNGENCGANNGDLVRFELLKTGRNLLPKARIIESLGNPYEQKKVSLIAVHAHGIPDEFPPYILEDLAKIGQPLEPERLDLTQTPLITIDPVDARDHDDAVYAEPDTSPDNPDGHIVIVAIADVAYYVRPGTQLDREARMRGNSVYFPDRVVPMLPERLSNELCSLRERENRPCIAVKMIFNRFGEKRSHTFYRAQMKSAARLSYDQVQRTLEGKIDPKCAPLLERVLRPLWNAYLVLKSARDRRSPLDLDLPERKIELNLDGNIQRVYVPERLETHRLIEEMMIQANVAAAETLESKNQVFVYRIHDQPSPEKMKSLRQFLETHNLKIPPYGKVKSHNLNHVLSVAKSLPSPDLIHEIVLRSQSQAEYHQKNIGHFGLNLSRYAHFTSPIRRYADLLVHRALIRCLELGDGGLEDNEIASIGDMAELISHAERRAMAAERETLDRLIALYLADRIGCEFHARISGVTRAGLFVRLKETGADGFIPMSTLGPDYFVHVPEKHVLIGSRSGQTFCLGDAVSVILVEAVPSAGALRFEMVSQKNHIPGTHKSKFQKGHTSGLKKRRNKRRL